MNPSLSLAIRKFKDNELEFLEEYKQVCGPLAHALDLLQGDRDTFMGSLIPTLLSVEQKLQHHASATSALKYGKPLAQALLLGIRKRFDDLIELNNKEGVLAAVTHPKVKLRWVPSSKFASVREMFLTDARQFAKNKPNDKPSSAENPDPEDEAFFYFPSEQETQDQVSHVNTTEMECLSYLQNSSTGLEMLGDYPIVKRMFIRYNTAIPSSAPVDELFSFAGMILSAKRNRTSDQTFETLLLVKCNGTLNA